MVSRADSFCGTPHAPRARGCSEIDVRLSFRLVALALLIPGSASQAASQATATNSISSANGSDAGSGGEGYDGPGSGEGLGESYGSPSPSRGACTRLLAVPEGLSADEATAVRAAHARSLELAAAYRQPRTEEWHPNAVDELHSQYDNIFRYGNRNAASHLWSSFILDRAFHMEAWRMEAMFRGFCAVSGSPVWPSESNLYGYDLSLVPSAAGRWPEGAHMFGYMQHCCWPCVCDTKDWIKVDTRTVVTADSGPEGRQYYFAVLGNPCAREGVLNEPFTDPFSGGSNTLARVAPEVRCNQGQLEGATLSDNGYVIIGMFMYAEPMDKTNAQSFTPQRDLTYQREQAYAARCEQRKQAGYNSGMGEIFRRVAGISPILTHSVKTGQCDEDNGQGEWWLRMPNWNATSTARSEHLPGATDSTTTSKVSSLSGKTAPAFPLIFALQGLLALSASWLRK